MKRFISKSPENTEEIGRQIGAQLPLGAIVSFFGELGTGKTTLIKGMVSELTGLDPLEVNSPTFTYLNIYEKKQILYHFDLYRLKNGDDFLIYGFDEYLDRKVFCLIEWAEKIESLLKEPYLKIHMEHLRENQRVIRVGW